MTYWAHSDSGRLPLEHPDAHWQKLSEHLGKAGLLASSLAENASPDNEDLQRTAALCGYLHDLGKYTDCFQKMITTGQGRCQHSVHGAVVAYHTKNLDAAFAIAGHHAGIPDGKGGRGTLDVRIQEFRNEALSLHARAATDCPLLDPLFDPSPVPRKLMPQQFDLHTRMLFSCLVDADRLDSGNRKPIFASLNADGRLVELLKHIKGLADEAPEGDVKRARLKVLDDCLNAAAFPEKLLSLTVPTGGGKTLSAMAFALQRAALFPKLYRRIIVVIPYLSIIEQNAEVYAGVFGCDAILEHHSGSFDPLVTRDDGQNPKIFVPGDTPEDRYQPSETRLATENWDAPLIVTTSVRFFESLFSNRPSDLRRVHNIARSIVILDEVQTLPRRLLAPLLTMIRELSDQWGCTFVFSTATQPAFEKLDDGNHKDSRWPSGTMREIVRNGDHLHRSLKRVVIDWELDRTVDWPDLASRLLKQNSVLCVVNLREHASKLFDELHTQCKPEERDSIFHLSTRMCAAHRLVVLALIRDRLKNRPPCRVISTQLVEAGVDLDFAIAFRALGPLDSVLQVAGRADREGLLTARLGSPAGRLVVFRPDDERTPPHEYKEASGVAGAMAREALRLGQSIHPESAQVMSQYWNRFYGEGQDQGADLQAYRLDAKFATLAKEFEMINHRSLDVFVPFDAAARTAIDELRGVGQLTRDLRRRLQRYVVGLQPYEFESAKGVLEEIRKDNGIWVAVDKAYVSDKGLKLSLDETDTII